MATQPIPARQKSPKIRVRALCAAWLVLLPLITLPAPAHAAVPQDAIHRGVSTPTNNAPARAESDRRDFWSLQPLHSILPPVPRDAAWGRTPVDAFIRSRQEAQALQPNAPASPRRLLRRLYLDLTGLPPTPGEVEAFVRDPSPAAYARQVDQLLAGPHYGERWGRHWLDVARFGESHGFEHDTDRPNAYHYRDFVIQALNADLPYDRFVQWQIAGDELAPEELLAWKATGFLAAGTHATQITANQAEKERYDELDDIVSTIGTSMLGLSLGCARCHDHKYDPVTTADYYRMVATFTTTVRSDHELEADPEAARRARLAWEAAGRPLAAALARYEREELPGALARWEATGKPPELPQWLVLDAVAPRSREGTGFRRQADGSFLASGKNADFDLYSLRLTSGIPVLAAVKIEALADPSMQRGGPGRAGNGNFDLTDLRLWATGAAGNTQRTELRFGAARATFEQKGLPVSAAIDGDPRSGWAVDPQFGTNHAAVFTLAAPLTNALGVELELTLAFNGNNGHNIGRLRVSVSGDSAAGLDGDARSITIAEARRALSRPVADRTESERAALLAWFKSQDPGWLRLQAEVETHARKEPRPEKVRVLVSSEGLPPVRLNTQGPDFYEKSYFLKRGDLSKKEGEAAPGFLPVLMRSGGLQERRWLAAPPEGSRTPHRRAALAHWITDVDQGAGPLLARVIVNRLWQHHFGQGIVGTPSDFGAQGARPTHPELLEWLAGELIRGGWRLKPIQRLILLSATYRQGPETDASRLAKDVANQWVWHFPRQRLDAEVIRDSMLSASGRLDPAMFGPGSLEESMTRRSIYFTVKRSRMIPMMTQFDAPDALQGVGRRVNTTVAPQSLLLINNPQVRACAVALAARLNPRSTAPPGPREVQQAFAAVLGRPPSSAESREALRFLHEQARSYPPAEGPTRALADLCQALFGLNEFLYVD